MRNPRSFLPLQWRIYARKKSLHQQNTDTKIQSRTIYIESLSGWRFLGNEAKKLFPAYWQRMLCVCELSTYTYASSITLHLHVIKKITDNTLHAAALVVRVMVLLFWLHKHKHANKKMEHRANGKLIHAIYSKLYLHTPGRH